MKYSFHTFQKNELRVYDSTTVKKVHKCVSEWRKNSGRPIRLRCRQAGNNVFARRVE